jgi:hypothetical protein
MDEKKAVKAEPEPASTMAKIDWAKPVAVASARFTRAMQLPGKTTDPNELKSEQGEVRSWTVEYLAAIRQFRITFTERGARRTTKVRYVPECHVLSWEPEAG